MKVDEEDSLFEYLLVGQKMKRQRVSLCGGVMMQMKKKKKKLGSHCEARYL